MASHALFCIDSWPVVLLHPLGWSPRCLSSIIRKLRRSPIKMVSAIPRNNPVPTTPGIARKSCFRWVASAIGAIWQPRNVIAVVRNKQGVLLNVRDRLTAKFAQPSLAQGQCKWCHLDRQGHQSLSACRFTALLPISPVATCGSALFQDRFASSSDSRE
jgi:hypothetical protein